MSETVVILDQASGYLQLDILKAYKQRYKKRVIVAGTIVERSSKLENDIVWHKVIAYNRSSKYKRIFTWIIATFQMFFILLRYRKAHVLAITNPPFTPFVPWLLKMHYDVLIYDLYPEALVQYNYLSKDSFIVKLWSGFNLRMFAGAKRIITLSEGMKSLVSKYTGDKSVGIIPIWTDNEFLRPIEKKDNIFLKEHSFGDKFLIVYSGNLGRTHPVEILVELARLLDPEYYQVVIIGGGHKWNLIKSLIDKYKLQNLMLLPWQPVENLPYTLSAADLSVVTLDEEASDVSVPSKTFNLMSVGNPILAIASEDSEISKLLKEYNCGMSYNTSDLNAIVKFIQKLKDDKDFYNQMAQNSYLASKDFTSDNAKKFI